MDTHAKLDLLGAAACYDDCRASDAIRDGRGFFAPGPGGQAADPRALNCISHLHAPDGRRRATLKILQTSSCQNNCNYCAFRAGRDVRRAHLTPDELARSFDLMYRAGLVESLFLSSGVMGTTHTMDEMLATVELVRRKYAFRGYVHLKLLPGVEAAQIAQAITLADRVSANLEAPTAQSLAALAPMKALPGLLGPLRVAAGILGDHPRAAAAPAAGAGDRHAGEWGNARLGLSTQFVVGPGGETDRELLAAAQALYRGIHLVRTYYSAFSPVRDTPLEHVPPTDPRRELRLYQADWLLRFYGFSADELPYDAAGGLRADLDPKAAWAAAHPERFPVEVNRAPLAELLRVPGIGPSAARAIIRARRQAHFREIGDLRRAGARVEAAAPYVLLAGRRPPHQPPLPL